MASSSVEGCAALGNPAPLPQNAITHRLVLASWHRLEAYWSLMPIILIHALPPPLIACISKLHLTEYISWAPFNTTQLVADNGYCIHHILVEARSHTDRRWSVIPPLLRMLISLVASAIHWLNKHHQLGRTRESPHISSPPAGPLRSRSYWTHQSNTHTLDTDQRSQRNFIICTFSLLKVSSSTFTLKNL